MSDTLETGEGIAPPSKDSGTVGKRVAKATGAIVFGQMAAKILGAVEKPLMALRFGTGAGADAFGAAVGLVLSLTMFVEQLLQHSFMPTFIQVRTRSGEKESWKLASTVVCIIVVAFAALGIVTFLFAPQVVGLATKFRNPQATQITIDLLRIMIPALIVLPVSSLTYVILNSYKIFGLPAAADVAFKSGTVIALLFLAAKMGIPALALGVVLGTVVKVVLHLLGMRAPLRHFRPKIDLQNPDVRRVGILAVPLLLGSVLAFFRPLWDNWLASGLAAGGAVAALRYGRAVVDTPAQIFPLALRRALFPFMSEMAARDESDRMTEIVVRSLRVVAVVFVPMTVGMILLRYPIVETIYQWGKFDKDSTALVVPVVTFLAMGLLAMGAEMILLEPYFAMSDTVTPTKIAVVTFVIHIAFTGAVVLGLGWGVGGIALGYTVARTAKVVILAWGLRGRLAPVPLKPLVDFGARLTAAVAAMAVVVWIAMAYPVLPRGALALERQQLKDKSRLVAALADPKDPRAPLAAHLLAGMSQETRQDLAAFYASIDPPRELKEALAADLNRLLQAGPLYNDTRFADASLEEDLWSAITANPTGSQLVQVNRRLLDETYSNRLPAMGGGALSLDPFPAGKGSTGALYLPEDLDYRARFIATLKEPKDPVSRHIRDSLSPETLRLAEAYPAAFEPSRELRVAVVTELNKILQGECLYDEQRFAGMHISGETRKLMARRPKGTTLLWLNRLLLEEAYRDEIAPPSKWVDLFRLSVPSALGAFVFVLLCMVLRVEEATYLFGAVLKRLRRRRG